MADLAVLAALSIVAVNPRNSNAPHSERNEQKKSAFRDPIVWATVGIFLATAAAVGVGYLQYLTLEKTDETLRAQTRPWVSISILRNGPLIIDENSAHVDIVISLKNTGNTPATGIRLAPKMVLYMSNEGPFYDEMRRICAQERNPNDNISGWSIFPNDSIEIPFTLSKKRSEIETAFRNFPGAPDKNDLFAPVIVGCVGYNIPNQRGRPTTEFIREMKKRIPDDPDHPIFFKLSDGSVAAKDLVFGHSLLGANAY